MQWGFSSLLVLLSWLFGSTQVLAKDVPTAKMGVIDLRDWDFETNPTVDIKGEFEFYWMKMLKPQDLASVTPTGFLTLPSVFNFNFNGIELHPESYATFRIKILLPEKHPPLGYFSREVPVAYKLWMNGAPLLSQGVPGTTAASTVAKAGFPNIDIDTPGAELELVFNLSGFLHSEVGFWNPIVIGKRDTLAADEVNRVALDSFLASCMFVMALYHFVLFALRRQNTSALALGIYLLLVLFRVISTNDGLLMHRYLGADYISLKFTEYLTFYLSVPCIMWFLYTLFPQDFPKKLFQAGLAISSIFWIICLATPLRIYSQTVAPFQLFTFGCIAVGFYGLAKAAFHRRPGALVMIAGCILLTATVINDILHASRVINTSYIIGFGIYALVFSQSVVLATIFSKAFHDVETGQEKIKKLNRQLEDHIINLDAIVDEKTREIRSIMTHIQQGICLVEGQQVKVSSEYSKHMEEIAGSQDIAGQRLVDLIFQDSQISNDLKSRMHSTLHAAIGEDPIAFEANAHLLTHEFTRQVGSSIRTYEIDWNPIEDDQGLIDKFLVAIKDVTSIRILQEESLKRQNELKLISEIINVPIAKFDSFIISCREFITENREAVARSSASDREALVKMFRNMHTLKGAARSFSFDELAALAHDAETYYQELRDQQDTHWNQEKLLKDLDAVAEMVEIYARINAEKLGRSQEESDAIIIDREIVEKNMARLSRMDIESFQDGDRDLIIDLKNLFNNLVYNPLNKVLEEQIHSLGKIASDLGKANPILRIEDPGISFTKPAQELMIKVFTHMFRNSLDHGIELPDFRQNHGKEAEGQMNIKMYLEHGQLKLEYWDDGAGLNLPLIKKTAIRKGLIQGNESFGALEIGEFIFHPGFSTKREVSEISGRGVGMDAMRGFLEDHNAQIDLWIDAAPDSKALGFVPCKFILTLPETYFDIINTQGNVTAA